MGHTLYPRWMTGLPGDSRTKANVTELSSLVANKLNSVEISVLELVHFIHHRDVTRRAQLISLLLHAQLLSRGARPTPSEGQSQFAVLAEEVLNSDPIRIPYTLVPRPKTETLATVASQLQLSVVETDAQIFISLTDTTTDKFGHVELSGLEHVRLDCVSECAAGHWNTVYPQLDELLSIFEESLWKAVLPSPPLNRLGETERKKDRRDPGPPPDDPQRYPPTGFDPVRPTAPGFPFPDYGRSDLDPFGSLGGRGGMILDPRRPLGSSPFGSGGGTFMGGPDVLPPGAVPPGARFDPFGPGVIPPRPRFSNPQRGQPDPDHALPPGFEDVYL
ncbi:proteasome inhibitor PI31 subunit [Clonorchis sinensis]|uniref:Proteasome inhibitor PI31 subunit n=2 Tax=Clonorchis sinensis TaxID=79923 RepID=H2KRG8_CLOSI|nr:proteasome inhibitor PI31 subunit [Clonorchis sinensis]